MGKRKLIRIDPGAKIMHLLEAAAVILALSSLASCVPYRRIAPEEHLLKKNRIEINGKRSGDSRLNAFIKQQPNRKFLGIAPLYLSLYNTASPTPDKDFEEWLEKSPLRQKFFYGMFSAKGVDRLERRYIALNKWLQNIGEAPVVYDPAKSVQSAEQLREDFFNHGYFNAQVDFSASFKGPNAKTDYRITTGEPYFLDSLSWEIDSPVLDSLYRQVKDGSRIVSGQQYSSENFAEERKRLTLYFQQNGIYNFQENYITFQVDTNQAPYRVQVKMNIADRVRESATGQRTIPFKPFKISRINVYTDYSYEKPDAVPTDTIQHKGVNIFGRGKIAYRPRVITDNIFLKKDEIFNIDDYTSTRTALRSLRLFQTNNVVLEPVRDSLREPIPSLEANIYLSPVKKYSTNISLEGTRSSLLGFGANLNLSLIRNNAFRGGEIWTTTLRATVGNSSAPTVNKKNTLFNAYEFNLTTGITFPRFLLPFRTEGLVPKYMMPKTTISAGGGFQKNIGLDRNYFNVNLEYLWDESRTKQHKIGLIKLSYVKNLNKINYFRIFENQERDEVIAQYIQSHPDLSEPDFWNNPQYAYDIMQTILSDESFHAQDPAAYTVIADDMFQFQRYTTDYFIPSLSYTFTFNNQRYGKENAFHYFQGEVATAGNILSAFNLNRQTLPTGETTKALFGVPIAQFAKITLDYRKYWNLTKNSLIAFRFLGGAAIPYGNSTQIPFSEAFFAGGVNWERGWKTYDLGPGGVQDKTYSYNIGNLRLLLSLEYRFQIWKELYGAIFVDSGNVWYTSKKMTADPMGVFRFDRFYKELATDVGAGLRYDLKYFVVRFDVGLKTWDPSRPESRRFVLFRAPFKYGGYNIAIAYPF